MARSARRDDGGLRASIVRNGVGAIGLVLVVTAAFAFLGNLGAPDVAAAEGEQAADPGEEAPAPGEDAVDPGGKPLGPPLDPPAPPTPDEPVTPPDGEEAEEPEPGVIPPGDISVQVLDGYQQDGGSAAAGVAAQLRDAGYQVVAENPAIAYEVTTVLWTPGFEAEARQVAEEIGAPEVREQPGNLSTQVAVHVVVGADRG